MTKFGIVFTTIYSLAHVEPFIRGYLENFDKHGRAGQANFYVIGDLKTPGDLKDIKDIDSNIFYYSPDDQRKLFKKETLDIVPWNCTQRRNLGFIISRAMEDDVVISLDDDNYANPNFDFLREHSLGHKTAIAVSSKNNWINPCDVLSSSGHRLISRGFPMNRLNESSLKFHEAISVDSVCNLGLWLGDPDVDALTNIVHPEKIETVPTDTFGTSDSYIVLNTQNVSFAKEIAPIIYAVYMRETINGLPIDRYDDVWLGMFLSKVLQETGKSITFGPPASIHTRHAHDFIADLKAEYWGMLISQNLVPVLESIELSSQDYISRYDELTDGLLKNIDAIAGTLPVRGYLSELFRRMKLWSTLTQQYRN